MHRLMGSAEYKRVTTGTQIINPNERYSFMATTLPERLEQIERDRKNGTGEVEIAFVDLSQNRDWGGWHKDHLGCVVSHKGTVWVEKRDAPEAYDLPRIMTGHESCRAMGLDGLAEVAKEMGLRNEQVAAVCGQSISWWAAEVLVEVLMVAFPSVAAQQAKWR